MMNVECGARHLAPFAAFGFISDDDAEAAIVKAVEEAASSSALQGLFDEDSKKSARENALRIIRQAFRYAEENRVDLPSLEGGEHIEGEDSQMWTWSRTKPGDDDDAVREKLVSEVLATTAMSDAERKERGETVAVTF